MRDSFDLDRLRSETALGTIEHHDELPSTNDRALEMCAAEAIETPLLVLAERQTAGRGRGANRWWSNPGALTLSLVVDATTLGVSPERRPQMSLTAGLAVCEVLRELLPESTVGLKWPNDVHLQARKVCGILVEIPPQRPETLVIGIGLNVNNSFAAAPLELQQTATSLVDVAGQSFDATDVLVRVLQSVDVELADLANEQIDLTDRWRSYCLLQGRTVHLAQGPRVIVGVCRGIDADGALVLQTELGPKRFLAGTVERIE